MQTIIMQKYSVGKDQKCSTFLFSVPFFLRFSKKHPELERQYCLYLSVEISTPLLNSLNLQHVKHSEYSADFILCECSNSDTAILVSGDDKIYFLFPL